MKSIHKKLSDSARAELTGNILPFWMNRMVDEKNGGFYSRINGKGQLVENEDKGGILNARILWSFSAAFNHLGNIKYKEMAVHAKDYALAHFFDPVYSGTFWTLDFKGRPADTKKQIYSQAFFIYALVEYYMASGDKLCLEKAIGLFHLIEEKSFDILKNGYLEAFSREWNLLEDLRLSAKDDNEKKTTNTHLHILEAYTSLYKVWKNEKLAGKLRNLTNIFVEKIIHRDTHHLNLFFDEDWNSKSELISYGHDIEASWLVYEAAAILEDNDLMLSVKDACINLGRAALEGLQPDGSLIYEKEGAKGHVDGDRHWWPQAEAVVGLLNLYEMTTRETYLNQAIQCWEYIKNHLVDHKHGEWFWSIKADGSVNTADDKAGFWKCPYHNTRACLEIMHRTEKLMNLVQSGKI
jgi:mannobiose 2-epimerase